MDDKKTVIQMLQSDFTRFHQDSMDISKSIQNYKRDVKIYLDSLIAQISTSGTNTLLAKTPKVSKKRVTRIKPIPENCEIEINTSENNTSSRSSRADTVILEVSDIRPSRLKRGASVKAADVIKKQSSLALNTKLRRPSKDDIDVPLSERVSLLISFYLLNL